MNLETQLLEAVKNERLEIAQACLLAGASPNTQNSLGYTCLITAICNNQYDMAELLITHGADVNLCYINTEDREYAECYKTPPIIFACESGCLKTVNLLIDSGADVNKPRVYNWHAQFESGTEILATPLMVACENGHLAIARALTNAGARAQ